MAYQLIQWSNHARNPNGTGKTRNRDNMPVESQHGYIHQAMEVALNPHRYRIEDLEKATRVLNNRELVDMAKDCIAEVEQRRAKEKARKTNV